MRQFTKFFCATIFLLAASTVSAQFDDFIGVARYRGRQPLANPPGLAVASAQTPSLVAQDEDAEPLPLELEHFELSVRILGFLIETTATYTFRNPQDQQTEGIFTFPLPDGVTVDGYALDVDGQMIDGVPLERKRATYVFDEIQRRGIDPGLVEQIGHNVFRSRIFPIPNRGARTIRVRYTDRITSSTYTLPTAFDGKIGRAAVDIEAKNIQAAPKIVTGNIPALEFTEKEDRKGIYVAKTECQDIELKDNLILEFSEDGNDKPRIVCGYSTDNRGRTDYHFVYRYPLGEVRKRLEPLRLQREKELHTPKRIAVYWDASGSHADTDHAGELELLRKYLERKQCTVELYFFRDTMAPAGVFESDDYEKLFTAIQDVSYDGGTNFWSLVTIEHKPDLALMFSDGHNTLGLGEQVTTDWPMAVVWYEHLHPTYLILSGNTEKNDIKHPFIEAVFNLAQQETDAILDEIGNVSISIPSHSASGAAVLTEACFDLEDDALWIYNDAQWNIHVPLDKPFSISFHLAIGGHKSVETLEIPIVEFNNTWLSDIPKQVFSQRKLAELRSRQFDEPNSLRQHCLKYGLVTSETSLIVLESLDQYLEFNVEPPDTQPDWQHEYRHRQDVRKKQTGVLAKQAERYERSATIQFQREWETVVRWWKHSFEVPEGYRYVPQFSSRNEAFAFPRDRHHQYYLGFGFGWGIRGGMGGSGGVGGIGLMRGSFGGGMFGREPTETVKPVSVRLDPSSTVRKSPYLVPIREAAKESPEKAYAVYIEQRKLYARSPLFFWESAILFQELGQDALAFRILRNILELELGDDPTVRRMIGFLLLQWNRYMLAEVQFDKALALDENDLAAQRGLALSHSLRKILVDGEYDDGDCRQAKRAFDKVIDRPWVTQSNHSMRHDYSNGFRLVTAVERRRNAIQGTDFERHEDIKKEAMAAPLDVDLRIVAAASHKGIDVALSVTEPHSETVRKSHALSVYGGALDGHIAEQWDDSCPALIQYMIRRASKGTYKIAIERFDRPEDSFNDDEEEEGERPQTVKPVTAKGDRLLPGVVFVDIFTNYGRDNESRRSLCVTLDDDTEVYEIGEVEW